MSNYRIFQKRVQIEKPLTLTRRGAAYAPQIVTRNQSIWSGETVPSIDVVIEALDANAAKPENSHLWRGHPTIISERILVQEQRTPRILGWKTLQLADIAPPYNEFPEVSSVEIPQQSQETPGEEPSRIQRILAFAMTNDPIFNAARR